MKEQYKTLVRDYFYKGNDFVIVKGLHDGIIRAVNYKYLDENGLLTKQLNGAEMFVNTMNNTINGVMERINSYYDWKEFVEENNVNINDETELLNAMKVFYKLA